MTPLELFRDGEDTSDRTIPEDRSSSIVKKSDRDHSASAQPIPPSEHPDSLRDDDTPQDQQLALTEPTVDRTGAVLADRFTLRQPLGVGALGAVYEAWDAELNEPVAIKIIPPKIASDKQILERIRRRVRRVREIVHQNVCRVFDLHRSGELHFLVMDYVPGHTLADEISRGVASRLARKRFLQLLDALYSIHSAGVVHGALHPAHIRVRADDTLVVMGAGLSAELLHGTDQKPTHYLCSAPEVRRGTKANICSDIYSVGEIGRALVRACPNPEKLPYVSIVAEKCLKPLPERRLASVPAVLAELRRSTPGHGNFNPPVSARQSPEATVEMAKLRRPTRRRSMRRLTRPFRRLWRARVPVHWIILLVAAGIAWFARSGGGEQITQFRKQLDAVRVVENPTSNPSFFQIREKETKQAAPAQAGNANTRARPRSSYSRRSRRSSSTSQAAKPRVPDALAPSGPTVTVDVPSSSKRKQPSTRVHRKRKKLRATPHVEQRPERRQDDHQDLHPGGGYDYGGGGGGWEGEGPVGEPTIGLDPF